MIIKRVRLLYGYKLTTPRRPNGGPLGYFEIHLPMFQNALVIGLSSAFRAAKLYDRGQRP